MKQSRFTKCHCWRIWILILVISISSHAVGQESTSDSASGGDDVTPGGVVNDSMITSWTTIATTTELRNISSTTATTTTTTTASSATATSPVEVTPTLPTTTIINGTVAVATTRSLNGTGDIGTPTAATADNSTVNATTQNVVEGTQAVNNSGGNTTVRATAPTTNSGTTSPSTAALTTTTASPTTTTATTTVTTTTTTSDITATADAASTAASPRPTIIERVKELWNDTIRNLNFSRSSLNETLVLQMTGGEVVNVIISYYRAQNESTLKTSVEDNKVSDVAALILQGNAAVVEENVTNQFINQSLNLHGFYASLHWFHSSILGDVSRLQALLEEYAPSNGGNTSQNVTTEDLDGPGFIRFILTKAGPDDLFKSICDAAGEEATTESICPTPAPPNPPLPGPEKLESTWTNVIATGNYTFLSQQQKVELESVTSSNITTALVDYVKELTDNEIQALVATNVTRYVSQVLRPNGAEAATTIGNEAASALGGSTDREDVFYVYMNFLNWFLSDRTRFEATLKAYVSDGQSARRRKRATTCDKTTITADGIVCHVVTTEGNNITTLLGAVCDGLNGGTECTSTISDATEPTSAPVSEGLSTGAIVGIALGSFFGLLLIILIALLVWKYCCNRKGTKVSQQPANNVAFGNESENGDTNQQMRSNSPEPSRASIAGHPPNSSANGSSHA